MPRIVDRRDQVAARRFYQSGAWQKLRDAHIAKHPNCALCGRPGAMVDHKKRRQDRPDLALDPRNLQTLCRDCHDSVKRHIEHDDRHPLGGGVDSRGRPLSGSHPWNRAGNGSLERVGEARRADLPDERLARLAARIRARNGIQ